MPRSTPSSSCAACSGPRAVAEDGGSRPLPPWGAGDTGEADPRLAQRSNRAVLLAALADARVFAAVTATSTAEHVTEHGLRAESTAEMAVLLVAAGDERALPVFSSLAELQRWRPDARPVPLSGAHACRAALDSGAVAVLLDPASEHLVLTADEVIALAEGFVPVPGSRVASRRGPMELTAPEEAVDRALVAALRAALAPERLEAAGLLEGPDGLVLGIVPFEPLPPHELAALAQRVVERLGPLLPPGGLDLTQLAAPAGVPVLRPRRGLRLRRGR